MWGIFASDHVAAGHPINDVFQVLATCAASTAKLRVGTGVLLLALRPFVHVAKQLASLDHLAGGRLVAGVGVGGEYPEEWVASGVPVSRRGRLTDEYLSRLPAALAGGRITIGEGSENVVLQPAAIQRAGTPVWVGGRSRAALERAARHQGWFAYLETPSTLARKLDRLPRTSGIGQSFVTSYLLYGYIGRSAREVAGAKAAFSRRYRQDMTPFINKYCAFGDEDEVRTRVAAYAKAGANHVVFYPQTDAQHYIPQVERFVGALADVVHTQRESSRV
jgi:alkanesulfonate monooxygenase SsuD/methylene tetrahydromethanopterin reductase-like flavin-dependent oxidoreductase (luciferase family)